MAQQALGTGTTRRRVLFGLLDADGWAWAFVKAVFWFVVIIMMLGYLPDRAYYFTVFSTIDLGVNPASAPASYVTPINLCPPGNQTLPCPAPNGALVPWQLAPAELSLPAGRTDGTLVQVGTRLLFVGGSDGAKSASDVYVAQLVGSSSFDKWSAGPALPEARSRAAVIFSGGSVYVLGGADAAGKPTKTVFVLTPDPQTGALGQWKAVDALALPEERAGAAVVSAPDGLFLIGGSNASGPTATVWKSTADSKGVLGAWKANQDMLQARTSALAALVGDYLWVYGGSDAKGPTAVVERGLVQTPKAASPAPAGAAAPASAVVQWGIRGGDTNLPAARTDAAGFLSNGTMYLIGGSDGKAPTGEVYWTVPTADGQIEKWTHLKESDLPAAGLAGAAGAVSGPTAFLVGGTTDKGLIAQAVRASLSPQPPFFQLGLLGATVPALKVDGEIGQQLGYLNAAGVGTVDLVLLVLIGWAFAHKAQTRAFLERVRGRRH